MRVYWIRKHQVQFHLVPNMQVALIIVAGLKACKVTDIWIERELAHKRVGY